jgi:hypothetical protein
MRIMIHYSGSNQLALFNINTHVYENDMAQTPNSSETIIFILNATFSDTRHSRLRDELKIIRRENPRLDEAFKTGSFD